MNWDSSAPGTPSVSAMLDQLWAKFLPQIEERVAVLGRAVEELAQGNLSPALREDAHHAAHKLAGSLGTFGLADGTTLAREAENLLAGTEPVASAAASRLGAILIELQKLIRSKR